MNRKPVAVAIFCILSCYYVSAQTDHLKQLDQKLRKGDKQALYDIANYFDSKTIVTELLGYHLLQTPEATVAKQIVLENSLFFDDKVLSSDSITCESFHRFLNRNASTLKYSELTAAFEVTPFEKRAAKIDFRTLTPRKLEELRVNFDLLLDADWVVFQKIDSLIKARDPRALLLTASTFYRDRTRFNEYCYRAKEYVSMLEALTGMEFSVENEKGIMTWQIADQYSSDASLNLLIFWVNNYKDFKWDHSKQLFVNNNIPAKNISREESLFQLLSSEDSSIAMDAFKILTTADPVIVWKISEDLERPTLRLSYDLPTFPLRFLKVLSLFTEYCRKNNINFVGSPALQTAINALMSDLSFIDRRHLEDSLASNLSLNEINAFEYWAMIYEKSWGLTYSAGRILDIFYSKHWSEITKDKQQLAHYLKKSSLFDALGIIGVCNLYLKKFEGNGPKVAAMLDLLATNDSVVLMETRIAKTNCLRKPVLYVDPRKFNNGNYDVKVNNLKNRIQQIKFAQMNFEQREDSLVKLLARINYNQIGEALEEIQYIFLEKSSEKYDFLGSDFGFPEYLDFSNEKTREEFLHQYKSKSEFDVYTYYLNKMGIDFKNSDGSLNYDSIFEILKYNIVTAFVGGGGGKDDNEVYMVIKLLELTYHTTLGYPKKLCNSQSMYACSADDRAKMWMQFLKERKLLKKNHDEPVSFTSN